MHRSQRKCASRSNAARLDRLERRTKPRLAIDTGDHDRLLVLIHPPGDRLFPGYVLAGAILHLPAPLGQMPGDFVARFVVLDDADTVEFDDAAEFLPEHLEQLNRIAMRRYGLRDADQRFVA